MPTTVMADSPAAVAGALSFPSRPGSPLAAVAKRISLALGLLALSSAIVYLDRHGYRDAAHPGRPLSVLGSVYYATVTLSTIGYGDIVPVTSAARLLNTVVITCWRLTIPQHAGLPGTTGSSWSDPVNGPTTATTP